MTVIVDRPVAQPGAPPDGDEEREEPRLVERRRRPAQFSRADVGIVLASLAGAWALTWLVFDRLSLFSGALGFLLVWFVVFLSVYYAVVRETEDRIAAVDKTVASAVAASGLLVLVALSLIIGYTAFRGIPGLALNFFTETREFAGPLDPPEVGGLLHAIVGSAEQVGIAMLIAVPLGVLTAVFLNEVGGRLRKLVRTIVNAMSGVPSIVAGLFIYATVVQSLGAGFSGFAASLALAVLMLPTITRTSEEVLRIVPGGLREASLALGSPEWRTTWSVVLPTARSGLITAVVLGVARAVGETAPLIMTAFGNQVLVSNPFSGPQGSLPLDVYNLIRSPIANDVQRAWTGAFMLIVLVLALFSLARYIGRGRGATRIFRVFARLRSPGGGL